MLVRHYTYLRQTLDSRAEVCNHPCTDHEQSGGNDLRLTEGKYVCRSCSQSPCSPPAPPSRAPRPPPPHPRRAPVPPPPTRTSSRPQSQRATSRRSSGSSRRRASPTPCPATTS